jgi:hypothetical protein
VASILGKLAFANGSVNGMRESVDELGRFGQHGSYVECLLANEISAINSFLEIGGQNYVLKDFNVALQSRYGGRAAM